MRRSKLLFVALTGACAAVVTNWALTQLVLVACATPGSPHEGMKLIFEDDFDGTTLDLRKWYAGGKPSSVHPTGEHWSDSHFVSADEAQFAETYRVRDGILTMRATYNPDYRDPQNWGRKWFGAEISSALPNGTAQGSFRKGYTEVRMKVPAGKGSWPAFWMLEVASIDKSKRLDGVVEINVMEHYGFLHNFNPGIHNWEPNGRDSIRNGIGNISVKSNITTDFHTYGCLINNDEVVYFFDGSEIFRKPLPRAASVSPFFLLLDMAVGGGYEVEVPPSGYYETQVDYAKIWSNG